MKLAKKRGGRSIRSGGSFVLIAAWCGAAACERALTGLPDGKPHSAPAAALTLSVSDVPAIMRQIGLELTVQPRGPFGIAHSVAFLDSGAATQQSFGPVTADSVGMPTFSQYLRYGPVDRTNRDFHIWIPGPLAAGPHSLSVTVVDDSGRAASVRRSFVVDVPTRAYTVTQLTVDGAIDTYANGINASGAIALTARMPDSSTRAFRWTNGIAEPLAGASSSSADRINDAGVVAGYVGRATHGIIASGPDSIVQWSSDQPSGLAAGLGYLGVAAIANDGTVLTTGNAVLRGRSASTPPMSHAMDMNDAGVVVGYREEITIPMRAAAAAPDFIGVPTPYDTFGPLPTIHCCNSVAMFVNDARQIIGTYESTFYLWSPGSTATWLINPLGRGTVAAISRGTLVLSRLTDGGIAVWTIGGATTRINPNDSAWTIDALTGINDAAQIIAHGVNKSTGQRAALLLNPM